MKKLLLILFSALTITAHADEGMWLPGLLKQSKTIETMRSQGLKLTADDLYSINQASLKDAIVMFGRGCTGELISNQGLLLTNHHCGYAQIQSHSSVKNDYLTYGFAAMTKKEELPNPGLTVSFLQEMTDITAEVMKGVNDNMTEQKRQEIIQKNSAKIIAKAKKNNDLRVTVESLYYGNQYFLFTYKIYEDVRLVFAPASAIGKFGGDTDNWMWPRHTGDFSIFRIYADKNNEPAKYSKDNVPFVPKKSFDISLKGPKEGDFTFVYGFPARTTEYLHSEAVRYVEERSNPAKIELRTIVLNIMNREQSKDPAVRIKYAAKNANVGNAWKKWQGELLGVQRLKTVYKKQKLETQFIKWSADKPEYNGTVEKLTALYQNLEPLAFANDYYIETAFSSELLKFALRFRDYNPEKRDELIVAAESFYKDYELMIDKEVTTRLLEMLRKNVDSKFLPNLLLSMNTNTMMDEIYRNTIFSDREKFMAAINKSSFNRILEDDPALELAVALSDKHRDDIAPDFRAINSDIQLLYRTYMRGLMLMQNDVQFYPDANFTLRISYGKVEGFTPRDGVYYKPFTTLEGVIQKDDPNIYDYDVPEILRRAYYTKNYGRWAIDGDVPVCFLASNHTTGGNSGSPVLNAEGHLIGINFDRCWESTMSDIEYDPDMCRNISVDIRYILFIIERIGGAGYLIDEMNLVQ